MELELEWSWNWDWNRAASWGWSASQGTGPSPDNASPRHSTSQATRLPRPAPPLLLPFAPGPCAPSPRPRFVSSLPSSRSNPSSSLPFSFAFYPSSLPLLFVFYPSLLLLLLLLLPTLLFTLDPSLLHVLVNLSVFRAETWPSTWPRLASERPADTGRRPAERASAASLSKRQNRVRHSFFFPLSIDVDRRSTTLPNLPLSSPGLRCCGWSARAERGAW